MPKNELSILASRRRAAWALKLGAVAVAATALLGATGCQKLSARDNLNRGVQAYRNANYEVAIERFRKAVQKDPSLLTARLYLANAYANLVTEQSFSAARTPDQALDELIKMSGTRFDGMLVRLLLRGMKSERASSNTGL